jgi:aspartate carbamoyltransferase catalytic subunit
LYEALLSTKGLTRDDAAALLPIAEDRADVAGARSRNCRPLRGKIIVTLFFEDAARARVSFEVAAKRLSAEVITFSVKGSSFSKGASLKDTAQTPPRWERTRS